MLFASGNILDYLTLVGLEHICSSSLFLCFFTSLVNICPLSTQGENNMCSDKYLSRVRRVIRVSGTAGLYIAKKTKTKKKQAGCLFSKQRAENERTGALN